MTVLTILRGHFVVTGPDIEPLKLKSRREAKDWCDEHHQGSPIKEIGANAVKRASKGKARRERECLMTWLQPSSSQLPRSSSPASVSGSRPRCRPSRNIASSGRGAHT